MFFRHRDQGGCKFQRVLSCVLADCNFLMTYNGHHEKIYFSIPVNAFQIPLTNCFEKLSGSQVKSKLHLLSCLNEIFISRTLPK
jgi:hypothetical protein